jgi:pentose-5-phosphate-3-epimerase
MSSDLSARAREAGVVLMPSLIAIPRAERQRLTVRRARSGDWVHADVIEGSFLGQPGISHAEIDELARIPGALLDVHLMVDDPLDTISRLPPSITRITVQIPPTKVDLQAIFQLIRARGAEAWLGIDGDPSAAGAIEQVTSASGTLVLLTPPGQPGHRADLKRLTTVSESLRMTNGPVGVDGGVNRSNLDDIISAGGTYVVVGRAFNYREITEHEH